MERCDNALHANTRTIKIFCVTHNEMCSDAVIRVRARWKMPRGTHHSCTRILQPATADGVHATPESSAHLHCCLGCRKVANAKFTPFNWRIFHAVNCWYYSQIIIIIVSFCKRYFDPNKKKNIVSVMYKVFVFFSSIAIATYFTCTSKLLFEKKCARMHCKTCEHLFVSFLHFKCNIMQPNAT